MNKDRTAKQTRVVKTGQPEQESQDKIARIGQSGQDSQNRIVRQDSQNRTDWTGQPKQVRKVPTLWWTLLYRISG